jgi:cytochrome c biogenesis protein CcmG/thiol:disulfide interchange protein DsbE
MSAKRFLIAAGGVLLLVLVAIGLVQLAGTAQAPSAPAKLTPAQMRSRLSGSAEPLLALHEQADQLLSGGMPALRARLASLRGWPIVINKWASWCLPCRAEFGAFQGASVAQGRKVAFIGIDSGDTTRGDALAFLREFPVSYPSYYDPSGQLGELITDSTFTPVTVFYDRDGAQYIHQGPYPSQAKLEQDIRRYALDA